MIHLNTNSRIFKFKNGNQLDYALFEVNLNDIDSFRNDLGEKRKLGYSLVIINADLMSSIMSNVLQSEGIIHEIKVSDPTADEELTEEIRIFIEGIRKNPTQHETLLGKIKWMLNSDSIFIDEINFTVKSEDGKLVNSHFFVNGILNGEDNDYIFHRFILSALKK